ncbi:4470_t:CDS:2, partial [Funneliformis geosporum]
MQLNGSNGVDTKYKTINDIKNEKKADGTGFFTPEELTYFDDPLIENKLNNAASVAELVEEVQKGETATKKEQALSTKLNSEKTNGTVAFRVVNRRPNYRVDNAIFRLSLYLGNSERTKAERETRVTEIDKKIAENNLQRASKEKVKRGMELTLGEALEEKSRMEKVHKINNNLQVVLTGAGKLITADKPDGVDISTLTDLYKVKDYSIGDNVHKDDSTTITDIYGGATGNTVTNILDHAKSFLGKVKDLKASLGNKKFFIPTSLSLYNDRKINCKNNISNGLDEFGIMYLSVLRSIGSEKLEKVIAASGSSKKTKLEKNIKKITKYISKIEANVGEELTIKQITDYAFGQKAVEYADKQERNAQNFLKKVFPLKTGTTSYELAAKPYLDDINDANFLKPSTTGDKGTGHKASAPDNNITNTEAIYAREVECLKYCRTMRELFLEMKISS